MTSAPAPVKAAEIYPDVADLAQKIVDKTNELVTGVESLDANNWLSLADDIDSLNSQLQALLIPVPPEHSSHKAPAAKSNS